MRFPYAQRGRPCESRAGRAPNSRKYRSVPVKLTVLGGQPARFTVEMPRALLTPTASVGLGRAAGIFPQTAQAPMQIVAAALEVTLLPISMPVSPLGPS